MSWPHVFSAASGVVPASFIDDNFNAAAELASVTALTATVAALPSNTLPLIPVAGGSAGVSAALSRVDHQHPPQSATINAQVGTSYTVVPGDNGKVLEFTNAAAITVTFPTGLGSGFNCLCVQTGAGAVTFAGGGGMTQQQRSGYTKTAGIYAVVSMYLRASGTDYILSGDMVA